MRHRPPISRLPLLFLTFLTSIAGATLPPPALQISTEQAPAGGWTQIKIFAAKPTAIPTGRLTLNLDATVFGPGASVGLFGANGDAAGSAATRDAQIEIQFSSASGGIGQIAGLPVVVLSVPVLASAAGRTVTVTATSPDASLSIASGSVTVSGHLSIGKIPAGGGVVPAGTVVPVTGTGFTPQTKVTMDGVAIASTRFVSSEEIDITLAGAAELVGKHAHVTDGDEAFDYFCFQPDGPLDVDPAVSTDLQTVQPLFPLLAGTGLSTVAFDSYGAIAVENPNAAAAVVNVSNLATCCGPSTALPGASLTVPAGSWAALSSRKALSMLSSNVPVRVVSMHSCSAPGLTGPVCSAAADPYDTNTRGPVPPVMTPASLAFRWQKGAPAPGPKTVLFTRGDSVVVTFAASTTSGGSWLVVPGGNGTSAESFAVSVDPSQLDAGTYQGSVLVKQSYGPSAELPVTLTVTAAPVPVLSAGPAAIDFTATTFTSPPTTQTVVLTSDAGPAPFSVNLAAGTWLKVSPLNGTTPATLTVTWDPAVTSQFYYQQRSFPATIFIDGPGNQLSIPATFNVSGVQFGLISHGPNGMVFSGQTGSAISAQTIYVAPQGDITATTDQPWLAAASSSNFAVAVAVDTANLPPGLYHGTVTLAEPGIPSIDVPVVLALWSVPPPLTISVHSFTFVYRLGELPPDAQPAIVDSGGVPVSISIAVGGEWLFANNQNDNPTPTQIYVGVGNPPRIPGEYQGSFTIRSPGGAVYVPVTLRVEPGPVTPPVISQVVNAASGIAGGVSPGEIATIRGFGVGAPGAANLQIEPSGRLATQVNGTEVTFDGQPAPLLYTSANQTNLIVPYEVATRTTTRLQVSYKTDDDSRHTAEWVVPVVNSAPGIFTLDATGTGQAAVINEDGTVNSAANPAHRGSVISIYATGEGQTAPDGVTGSVAGSAATAHPLQPVTVTIGGEEAVVQYAGSAPGEVAGLLQVNAFVPDKVTPGPAVPVTLTIGGVPSQPTVTITVD